MQTHTVIIRPIVTEKSMSSVGDGKYSFVVARNATKTDIKTALKQAFNVNVVRIATSVAKGDTKRVGKRRVEVADAKWKKATVVLEKGQRISLFESGAEEKK